MPKNLVDPKPQDAPPPQDPPPGDPPPASDPPADPPKQDDPPADPPAIGERPAFIPESAWDAEKGYDPAKHFEEMVGGRRPKAIDDYELPSVEGFDAEAAMQSPVFLALRQGAYDAGVDQDGFTKLVTDYTEAVEKKADEQAGVERGKLGDQADARIGKVAAWLGTMKPEYGNALANITDTAAGVEALEQLMGGAIRTTPDVAATRKTKAQIEKLMLSDEYRGPLQKRDPAVIKEVQDWFTAEAERKKAGGN